MREHPKAIGDRSTLAVMAALREAGYGLYVSFGENTRSDLILENDDVFARVQCKTGRLRGGAVRFSACSCYGHHRNPQTARRDYHGQVDYFAVYCPEASGVYLVPIEDLTVKVQGALRVEPPRNNQARRIRRAADYEIGRVRVNAGPGATSGAGGSSA